MRNVIKLFVNDESGATAVEYGLLVALIAGIIIGAVQLLGSSVNTAFTTVASSVSAAVTPAAP